MPPPLSERAMPLSRSLTMRVASLDSAGRITLSKDPVPEPAPGQLRIQVELWSVAPSDLQFLSRQTAGYSQRLPSGLACEACGFVDAVGPNTPGWNRGERVSFHATQGAAEYIVC